MIFETGRQRALLWSFIASIALCATTGIFFLLLDTWGALQAKILGSTATIAAASVLALASTIPWERQAWQPIGPVGCAVAAAALVLGLFDIWTESQNDAFNKAVVITWILAIALPVIGILGLARLRPQYSRVRFLTVALVALFVLQLVVEIVYEPKFEWWDRAFGILGILSASGLIAVPILHKLSGLPRSRPPAETADKLTLICPGCGSSQEVPTGQSRCTECGLRFRIQIEA